MPYTWTAPGDGTFINKVAPQEIVDRIPDLETKLDAGCNSRLMSPSGRTISSVMGSDPLQPFTGWRPNMSPTFAREFVEDEDILTFRQAVDPLYDNRQACRVHFGGNYQGHRTNLESPQNSGDHPTRNANRGDEGDQGDLGDHGRNNGRQSLCTFDTGDNGPFQGNDAPDHGFLDL
jgi:hypothetical protein